MKFVLMWLMVSMLWLVFQLVIIEYILLNGFLLVRCGVNQVVGQVELVWVLSWLCIVLGSVMFQFLVICSIGFRFLMMFIWVMVNGMLFLVRKWEEKLLLWKYLWIVGYYLVVVRQVFVLFCLIFQWGFIVGLFCVLCCWQELFSVVELELIR